MPPLSFSRFLPPCPTGYTQNNPLSKLTAAGLEDIAYIVDPSQVRYRSLAVRSVSTLLNTNNAAVYRA